MQSNWVYEISELFLRHERSAALLTTEGEIVHSKSDLGFETPGFRSTVEGALKYISTKPGDIIVTNDPYSGGSFLHRYNFLLVLCLPEMNSAGFVLCVRKDYSVRLNPCAKLDEEGLRIPPTPIYQNKQLITPIINAMSMHPLCAQGFSDWLGEVVEELKDSHTKWQNLHKNLRMPFSVNQVKKFISFSRHFAVERISERAQGEGRSEVRLDSGEIVKLRLDVQDGNVRADFSGTTAGVQCFVPDGATFGACYDALSDFYDMKTLRNSGTFTVLQVIKPMGCFLNAKYPASTHLGLRSGVAAVKLAMNLALRQIIKTKEALNTESDLKLEMAFADGSRWLSQWSPKSMSEKFSLEMIESSHPVQFLKVEKDLEKSYLQVEFKVLQACQLRWHSDFTLHLPRLPAAFKISGICSVETQVGHQEWKKLASQGSTDLLPHTALRIQLWGHFDRTEKPEKS